MKPAMLLALLLWQASPGSAPVTANPQYLRYQRADDASLPVPDKAVLSSILRYFRMRLRR